MSGAVEQMELVSRQQSAYLKTVSAMQAEISRSVEAMTEAVNDFTRKFAAENADRCALFFDGEILSSDIPQKFFAENNFYTTAANRMARKLWSYAVTCEQVIECAEVKNL